MVWSSLIAFVGAHRSPKLGEAAMIKLPKVSGPVRRHPDAYNGLIDWPEYGPKNPDIAKLVDELAYGRGLRLAEIEEILADALRRKLAELPVPAEASPDET